MFFLQMTEKVRERFLNADYHEIKKCHNFHLNCCDYYLILHIKHSAKCKKTGRKYMSQVKEGVRESLGTIFGGNPVLYT